MPGTGERAYAYAKACGIIGKSFIGKRISRLSALTRLAELDRMVFPSSGRELPERELLVDLERRIIDRSVGQILSVAGSFKKPPELLKLLIRSYEYGDIKSLAAMLSGKTAGTGEPSFTRLGRFGTVDFSAYPDLGAMFRGTDFAFLVEEDFSAQGEEELSALQMRLDLQYYTKLWKAITALPKNERRFIEKITLEEIALRNAAWALRLRTYYRMDQEAVRARLIPIVPARGRPSLADDAIESLDMALDSRDDWIKWKRAAFLNPSLPGDSWTADPRYFQNAAAEYLYRLARMYFRRRPLSLDTVCCFIKLKQFEEDLLTSVAEGLGLGMSAGDVFALVEAPL